MPEPTEPECTRKIFIGGLSSDTSDDSLKDYFSKYGEIVDCIVMKDSHTKRSRGFGFVTFSVGEMVDSVQHTRPHTIDGKQVETKRVVPKQESSKPESHMSVKKVFVGGYKDPVDEQDLREFFSQFGSVEKIETFTDKETGKKKGFAFVSFEDYDAVDKCVLMSSMSADKKITIKGIKMEVKKALSPQEIKAAGGPGGPRGPMGGSRMGAPMRDGPRGPPSRGGRGGRSYSPGYGGGSPGGYGSGGYGDYSGPRMSDSGYDGPSGHGGYNQSPRGFSSQGGGNWNSPQQSSWGGPSYGSASQGGYSGGGSGGGYGSGSGDSGYGYSSNQSGGSWSGQGSGGGWGNSSGGSGSMGQGYGNDYGGGPVRSGSSYGPGAPRQQSAPYGGGGYGRK